MRVLLDYRAALRQPTGVGEYAHQIAAALVKRYAIERSVDPLLELTLFSSSWRDRLTRDGALAPAAIIDRRVPVRLLNLAWHRLEWPPAEMLTGATFDIVHSMHPLLMPARRAAQVVTIYDLNFLKHPERTRAEIRRDYPALTRAHAHRADHIIVISEYTASEVVSLLGVPRERITVCRPGAPAWTPSELPRAAGGYVLFFGTLEPRKNVGALLDAYERLAARRRDLPELLLAGKATAEAQPWLERIARPPLDRVVRAIGYVEASDRQRLYEGARLLVQPSYDEGFGLPVVEAMSLGVPVVAANRGALPEVLGDAGTLVDIDSPDHLASAIERLLDDEPLARRHGTAGMARACEFSWEAAAVNLMQAYQAALLHRARRAAAA